MIRVVLICLLVYSLVLAVAIVVLAQLSRPDRERDLPGPPQWIDSWEPPDEHHEL